MPARCQFVGLRRNFFEGHEIYRGACGGVSGNTMTIHHTEIECHASTVPMADGTVKFGRRKGR